MSVHAYDRQCLCDLCTSRERVLQIREVLDCRYEENLLMQRRAARVFAMEAQQKIINAKFACKERAK